MSSSSSSSKPDSELDLTDLTSFTHGFVEPLPPGAGGAEEVGEATRQKIPRKAKEATLAKKRAKEAQATVDAAAAGLAAQQKKQKIAAQQAAVQEGIRAALAADEATKQARLLQQARLIEQHQETLREKARLAEEEERLYALEYQRQVDAGVAAARAAAAAAQEEEERARATAAASRARVDLLEAKQEDKVHARHMQAATDARARLQTNVFQLGQVATQRQAELRAMEAEGVAGEMRALQARMAIL